jgi:hypothetical protein
LKEIAGGLLVAHPLPLFPRGVGGSLKRMHSVGFLQLVSLAQAHGTSFIRMSCNWVEVNPVLDRSLLLYTHQRNVTKLINKEFLL